MSDNHQELIDILRNRFDENPSLHDGLKWPEVMERLMLHPEKLDILSEMERTGGEPDVIGRDDSTGVITFCDCAPESPLGRRSLCYDQDALMARKANKPVGSALGMANEMGIMILTESQYRALQTLGEFDRKTSSWISTPERIRSLGGALFCDRRYGEVFLYHNGVESYYASRGFRGHLEV